MAGVWERLEKREIRRRVLRAEHGEHGSLPRPDLPAGTDLLPQIRHIVVLMMENHSYDNYLGMLNGRGEGLALGPDGAPQASNPRRDGGTAAAHHLASTIQAEHGPTQSWHASYLQWAGGSCDGFVRSVEQTVPGADPAVPMGYWTEQDLPFYYGLARTFPLADHWFSSCLGPTFPNRRFLIAGTAHGLIDDLPWDILDLPPAGTIFDMLTRHHISWANYHNVRPARVLLKRLLGQHGLTAARRLARLGHLFPPIMQTVRGNKQFTADLYPLGMAACVRHLRRIQQFFADADAGTLPGFSIVDPDFDLFSEENPQDIRRGESFAAEVIKHVMHGKGWPHTLLIWLYDEHGGYYDHVPPPEAVPPDDVPAHNPLLSMPSWVKACLRPFAGSYLAKIENIDNGPRAYDRYGFRVPAVIVSPYARPNHVTSTVYDHTSVLKLVQQKWNLPPLTRRDAAAESPLDALDLDGEPAFLKPPDLPAPSLAWHAWHAWARERAPAGRRAWAGLAPALVRHPDPEWAIRAASPAYPGKPG
ncbi:MAG TPA: alkaline phosphatase family protein [Streptosporangiaceae bacterium]|nr:alkaline phosphatase family protein [Streptosporangiaceae bacterium]